MAFLAGCTQAQQYVEQQNRLIDLVFSASLPTKSHEIEYFSNAPYRHSYRGSARHETGWLVASSSPPIATIETGAQADGTSRKGFGTFFYDHAEDLIFIGAFGLIFATASAFSS
jgi:hypothetical protein